MLAITRLRYPEADVADAEAELGGCLVELSRCRGFVDGQVGRALDDPALWVLWTRWDDVGSYRRALGTYDVKLVLYPLSARIVDEPSAFEVLVGPGATKPNEAEPRGAIP